MVGELKRERGIDRSERKREGAPCASVAFYQNPKKERKVKATSRKDSLHYSTFNYIFILHMNMALTWLSHLIPYWECCCWYVRILTVIYK